MTRSEAYLAGFQMAVVGGTRDDNPYFGETSKAGIRRYADEVQGSDWAVGFRDGLEANREKRDGPLPQLGDFVKRYRRR